MILTLKALFIYFTAVFSPQKRDSISKNLHKHSFTFKTVEIRIPWGNM